MLTQLKDPANLVTMAGLLLGSLAVRFALTGNIDVAVVCGLGALLADHADGVVARRLCHRPARAGDVGRAMDCMADIVSAGILPAVIVLQVSGADLVGSVAASVIVLASGLRLSYYSAFGLEGGREFVGVPVTYVLPVVGLLVLVRDSLPWSLATSLAWCLIGLAGLEVSNLRVRTVAGVGYVAVVAYIVILGAAISVRHWA